MNKSFLRVLEKTIMAMIGANPRGYLSTQLNFIQGNLHVWEEIDVSLCTISRGLHNLMALDIINLLAPPIRGDQGEWHGRKLIIKAASRMYQCARSTYHSIKKFLRFTERAALRVQPILTKSKVLNDYPRFPHYISSDTPFWENSPSLEGFRAFKAALGRL